MRLAKGAKEQASREHPCGRRHDEETGFCINRLQEAALAAINAN